MAYRASARSSSLSTLPPPSDQKTPEDITAAAAQKGVQSMATCVYQTHIVGYWRNVTVLWSKNLMNYSLTIQVEGDQDCTCRIDLKPWHFWAKKGYKTFEVDGNPLEAYWDLRSAKFSGSPEPCSDFYVALVSEEEVVLLLGDYKKKAYKRTKSRPALVDALFLTKKEHVFGKKSFSTRAKFDQRKKEHDIVVESSTSGPREPEMWISVDGIVVVHIKNLQWKFRGNQTVLVNKQAVQVFWDVHSWLFAAPGTGYGLFIFKPGATEGESDAEEEEEGRGGGDSDDGSGQSRYFSTKSYSKASDLCVFLYAWKGE